jgi:hypothetical protein
MKWNDNWIRGMEPQLFAIRNDYYLQISYVIMKVMSTPIVP